MTIDESPLLDVLTGQPVVTGGVLALGNFDGVHLGHRAVVRAAVDKARELGVKASVLTFEPHPYRFFKKDKPPFLLTQTTIKDDLLLQAGADGVVTLAFTPAFAALSPDAFIDQVLIGGCAVRHVVVGFDFVFGACRCGDRQKLRDRLEPLGIGVTEVPPLCDAAGKVISSTRIREALHHGDIAAANAMLGRSFSYVGTVQPGDKRGRTIGFPTANLDLGDVVRPRYGVYAVMARQVGGAEGALPGVANIGLRPTVGGQVDLLEFHLFDQERDLYGQTWEVELRAFLRPERNFAGLDALKAQIAQDVTAARAFLQG